jgi:ornithine carbamoyltransferase
MIRHLKSLEDLSVADLERIFDRAAQLKSDVARGIRPPLLERRLMTLVFQKPSLRTRVSFEAAMRHLGGGSVFLTEQDAGLAGREALADVARVLSGYSDVIVLRTFAQSVIDEFAVHSACPVVNGLSDDFHPCQALTDLFTMREVFGDVRGRRLVFVGDGNNVAASLALATALLGVRMTICAPSGYELEEDFLARIRARVPDADLRQTTDPREAVRDADVVYTDVWASMGQEAEASKRKKIFESYQVNGALMRLAPPTARFMHDLPARRGLEVTDDVIDGPQSIAFLQAENRMHLAKGLLAWLLADAG